MGAFLKKLDNRTEAIVILVLVVIHLAYSLLSLWASGRSKPTPIGGYWLVSVAVCVILLLFVVDLFSRFQ